MNIQFLFNSGKNPKWKYYLKSYCRKLIPNKLYQLQLDNRLEEALYREDIKYIMHRIGYYCRLSGDKVSGDFHSIGELKMCKQKVYYFDAYEYLRWFDPKLKMSLLPGDIDYVPDFPRIVKSRPISENNSNSVLLNMDKVRHFIFVKDKMRYQEKRGTALFRGTIGDPKQGHYKPQRFDLLKKYFNHPLFDLGEITNHRGNHNKEWAVPKLTIYQQLENKFILAIEGNDVASNLKWIMSSNSIAVMPRPTCETWFMEGTLIPNYHYIEIKEDFSDLVDKIKYYLEHEDEALEIIKHANEYVDQFRNQEREDIVSLLTLKKYLSIVNQ